MSDLSDNRSEPQENTPLPRNLTGLLTGSLSVVALFGMRVLQINLSANSTVRTFVDYHWQSISVISGSAIGRYHSDCKKTPTLEKLVLWQRK